MQGVLRVSWRVSPLTAPQVWRHCERCKQRTPFDCSGKFRSNAHKKRIDVWLIYRCVRCDATWNLPIHERRRIVDFEPAQFQAYAANEAEVVRRHAFDLANLRRHGVEPEAAAEVAVRKRVTVGAVCNTERLVISLALAGPCALRLGRLLARELGLSRSRLQALHDSGTLVLSPAGAKRLRQPPRDGQTVVLHLERVPDSAAAILQRAVG
jgi:hypothetical protein